VLFLILTISFGCGGGGSSGGSSGTTSTNGGSGSTGSGTNSLVGTWNFVSCTGHCSTVPNQLIFNANGAFNFPGPGGGTGTWTLSGNQLTLTFTSEATIGIITITWIDNNNIILNVVSGGSPQTTVWKRA